MSLERYFSPKVGSSSSTSTVNKPTLVQPQSQSKEVDVQPQVSLKEDHVGVDLANLQSDPGLRPPIMSYPLNLIEQVHRSYLLKGPCQPRHHIFPEKVEGNRKRKFVAFWFDEFKTWLEYSIEKDAVFCLNCYLFSSGRSEKGHDAFISEGFNTWRKKERLRGHVGDHNIDHNKCRKACEDLMNQAQHIEVSLARISKKFKADYLVD